MDQRIYEVADGCAGIRITVGSIDPVGWLKGTMCPVRKVLATWSRGELAEIPAGRNWDIVRTAVPDGWAALDRMHRLGYPIGPVLLTEPSHVLKILVPPGTAYDWDAADTIAMGEGEILRCPDPRITAPRSISGRSWLVAPDNTGRTTDPDALYAALGAARLAQGHPVRLRSGEGRFDIWQPAHRGVC